MPGVNLGPLLAHGRTAEIYAWGDGELLKLFPPGYAPEAVEREAASGRIVHAAGLGAPAVGAQVVVAGRPGLVYERVEGVLLLRLLEQRPWLVFHYARLMARLHAAMHDRPGAGLPAQHERLRQRITSAPRLSPAAKARMLEKLDALPGGDRICHGDFHPENIILAARGPVVIDWTDATQGAPLADVARTVFLLRDAALPEGMRAGMQRSLGMVRSAFCAAYLREYARLRPFEPGLLAAWQSPIRAARLSEGIDVEAEALTELVEAATRG